MPPFLCAIFLLCLSSLASTAANFTQVYEWPDELDYEWPSGASRTKTFKPEDIFPRHVAVYESRIFLSLDTYGNDIPVTLVSVPTSRESSASPKLTAFPSWDIHGKGHCNKIEKASGLEVDSVGRLWVLDNGSKNCKAKIWTIDLFNNDHTKLRHQFSFQNWMNDLVLDEKPSETFAYITRFDKQHIVVFSLKINQSWMVDTPGIEAISIALSPQEEPRQLYISNYHSTELYSISVAALRKGTRTANPKLIGKWASTYSYRMLMDNHGTMYAAFWGKNYIHSWNSSQPFQTQPFHEVTGQHDGLHFTFAFDQSGNLWLTVFADDYRMPRFRLFRAVVRAKSFKTSPAIPITTTISQTTEPTPFTSTERSSLSNSTTAKSWTLAEETATTEVQQTEKWHQLLIIILICTIVFCVVFFSLIILCLILRQKRNNSFPQNTNEALQQAEVQDEDSRSTAAPLSVPDENDDVSPAEEPLYEEVKHDQASAPAAPSLYERPIILSPRSARRVKAMPERPRTFEKFGEAPRAPVEFEYDDIGPAQPEPLYDVVAPEPFTTPDCEHATSESAQYLKVLP